MKKLLSKIMMLLFIPVLCITLTGCGAQKKEITATLDTFFTAMQEGNWDTVESMCEEDVLKDLSVLETMNLESYFYNSVGIEKEKLNQQAQDAVTGFVNNVMDNLVQDYHINNVKVFRGVGTAGVTITTFDSENADFLNAADIEKELSLLMETYATENMDTLLQIYNTQGEEGMLIAMLNDMLPTLMDALTQSFLSAETTETIIYVKVVNMDDKWMITNP